MTLEVFLGERPARDDPVDRSGCIHGVARRATVREIAGKMEGAHADAYRYAEYASTRGTGLSSSAVTMIDLDAIGRRNLHEPARRSGAVSCLHEVRASWCRRV
jgi:hypothetical protein